MKCYFCPAEIDHTLAIHKDDVNAQRKHSVALESWRQLTVHLENKQLQAVHVCPAHTSFETLTLSLKAGK